LTVHNYVVTPHPINEARAGYTGENTGTNYPYTAAGIQQALGLQLAGPPRPARLPPEFFHHRIYEHHWGTTSISKTNTAQVLDNLTWTKGRHNRAHH
jgi:hypothetical protein